MTRTQRAVLVVKLVGLYSLVIMGVVPVLWGRAKYTQLSGVVCGVIALLLIAFAQPIARLLFRADDETDEPPYQELLRTGLAVLGVLWLLGVLPIAGAMFARVVPALVMALPLVVTLGAALVFLARPAASARAVWHAATRKHRPSGENVLLGAGLVVLALYWLLNGLMRMAHAGNMMLAGDVAVGSQTPLHMTLLRMLHQGAFTTVGAVAMFAFACAAAERFGCPAESEAEVPPWHWPSPRTCLVVAVCVAVACLFLWIRWDPVVFDQYVSPVMAAVRVCVKALFRPVLVGLVVFAAARVCAPTLAGWMAGGGRSAEMTGLAAGRVALEIALTILALGFLRRSTWVIAGGNLGHCAARLPAGILLLVLKADVARLCMPKRNADQEGPGPDRASVFQPWLVVLGFHWLLASVPYASRWLIHACVGAQTEGIGIVTPTGIVGGLTFVVASRSLARLLSHGPLLFRSRTSE
jgi:hypothetical protein